MTNDRLTVKRFETLQLLISVQFGRFFPGNIPSSLLQSLLRTTVSLLQPSELEHYLSSEVLPAIEPSLSPFNRVLMPPSSPTIPMTVEAQPPSQNLAGFGQCLSDFVSSLSPVS